MRLLLSVILQVACSFQAHAINSTEQEGILIQQDGNADEWPDGTYSLPQPSWGCPHGWDSGWRYQDTEDHHNNNRKSPNIESKMKVYVGSNIKFYYCVKTNHGNSGYRWPQGIYCIARKGDCPNGFHTGSVYWDDEDHHNHNSKGGTLPDGDYGANTLVDYCCRNDGISYTKPIVLPTNEPFILYRYHGYCQFVARMRVSDLYIRWDDEDFHNHDHCSGAHPDANCRGNNHILHFCYYHK